MQTVFNWLGLHYLEISAFIFGVLGVWLTAKQSIWCWPVGLANVALSLFVFFFARLYADVLLQVFYLVMTLYGWYQWLWGGEKKSKLSIRKIKKLEILWLVIIGIVGTLLMGWLFKSYTNASLPFIDSFVAVWGILATWAMAKKIMEHWIAWIFIDLICVAIYTYKEIYFFTALYFIFTLMAVAGLKLWMKDYRNQASAV